MVLVALKRSSSELSSYQKKILPVDDHVGVAIAGLTSDGRRLRYVCVGGGGSQDILGGRGECGRVRVVGMEECSVPVWKESGRCCTWGRECVCVEKVPPLLQQVHED